MARLQQELPEMQVQPVRQLVEGESRIVDRTHALMYGAVSADCSDGGGVGAGDVVGERAGAATGLCLDEGAGRIAEQLMGMFLLEALVLALAGVAVGFVVGSAAAWAISEWNFHTATLPRLSVLPLVLLLNVIIAAMAALFPLRVLRGLQPAALLKGE